MSAFIPPASEQAASAEKYPNTYRQPTAAEIKAEADAWKSLSVTEIAAGNEGVAEYIKQLEGQIRAPAGAVQAWRDIETAPKDTRVLIWSGQERYAAHWSQNPLTGDEAWIVAEWGTEGDQALVRPTHWQPLPPPPAAEGGAK